MEFISKSYEETRKIGYNLAKRLDACEKKRFFIALRGEMGVGKTAFTSGFAEYFDISGVKSPTYTIVNEYVGSTKIYHFDTYRISDGDDLYSIGYDDYVEADGYCICEWSEKIDDYLPEDAIYVKIERTENDECERKITISEECPI